LAVYSFHDHHFTIDTSGTKGLVGFLPGEKIDHDGLPTGEQVAVNGRSLTFNGAQHKAIWYVMSK